MTVTLESTDKIVTLIIDGKDVPARVWQGQTAAGIPCHAYITRIAVARQENAAEFDNDLREMAPPRADVQGIPVRLMLWPSEVDRALIYALKGAFETRLVNEVHRFGGIPSLHPDEVQLREAVAALLIAVFPNDDTKSSI